MQTEITRKAKVVTYGCQMNIHDSEILKDILVQRHYGLTEDLDQADLVLINTCSVRDHAEHKVFSLLGELKEWKAGALDRRIGVCGCMAQEHGEVFFRRTPYVDFVLGTHQLLKLGGLLDRMEVEQGPFLEIEVSRAPTEYIPTAYREDSFRAYITIMEGCNLSCTYCIVPYVRGGQRSRAPERILAEAADLAQRGFQEITLLGQTVNAYGLDLIPRMEFIELLEKLQEVSGLSRIRYTSSHPSFATEDFFRRVRLLSKVCEHFHLPVQSGSTRILKAMKRTYTAEFYTERVRLLREVLPGASLTTDIIVGFPGEMDADFEQTLRLVKELKFDSAYTFKYSPRPHTKAGEWEDDIPLQVKKERLQILNRLLEKVILEKNQKLKDSLQEVLVEEVFTQDKAGEIIGEECLMGHTRTFKEIIFKGPRSLLGKIVPVRVSAVHAWSLQGELVF